MAGKRGRSGRRRTLISTPEVEAWRREALEEYYDNREYKLRYAAERHAKIVKYAKEHNISFEEAVELGVGRSDFQDSEKWKYLWE